MEYKKGQIVTGIPIKIFKTHILVKLEDETIGIVHVSNVSDYFVSSLSSLFKINKEYEFEIIDYNNEEKKVKLNWKNIHPRFLKNPYEFKIKETNNGFKNLKDQTEKEVKND